MKKTSLTALVLLLLLSLTSCVNIGGYLYENTIDFPEESTGFPIPESTEEADNSLDSIRSPVTRPAVTTQKPATTQKPVVTTQAPVATEAPADPNEIQIYTKFLKAGELDKFIGYHSISADVSYLLFDMNGDGTRELYLTVGSGEYDGGLYTIKDGSVVRLTHAHKSQGTISGQETYIAKDPSTGKYVYVYRMYSSDGNYTYQSPYSYVLVYEGNELIEIEVDIGKLKIVPLTKGTYKKPLGV